MVPEEHSAARDRAVLVVEDEPMLRAAMVRGLAKLPGVAVYDAANVREARDLLARCSPRVIVSDLDLPDGSGVEVASEREKLGLRAPILFVSAYVRNFRSKLPGLRNIEVFEKPLSIDVLRAMVSDRLGPAENMAEMPFGLVDYVQLAGMGRRSVLLEVDGPGLHGQVRVREGELWSAFDQRGSGFDAFRRMAFGTTAMVTCRSLRAADLGERNLKGDCESVLLEAARIFDESGGNDELELEFPKSAPKIEPPKEVLEPAPVLRSSASRNVSFQDLYDKGIEALLRRDHREAYRLFCEARELAPHDAGVLAKIHRLEELGYGA